MCVCVLKCKNQQMLLWHGGQKQHTDTKEPSDGDGPGDF